MLEGERELILFQKIVNQKLNNLQYDELLSYANQYEIPLTESQAKQIVKVIKGKNLNIFDDKERLNLLKLVAKITSPDVAQKVNQLFLEFVK
ncbi:DUF2624 domain-containing protein [Bacillus alveayuensis]|uniref:DUF2624 domain-containing protein n=1 Tax=Aeribacillus alveayuensis TaxID=279215 RepID=UPI0038996D3F